MQVNCSTSHILNKTVSDDELRLLARMIDKGSAWKTENILR
ncbi:hypothetical protein P7M00_23985 [Vibrio parahaemolyticus]|nr:hypothetical protein [Vibrio parahaemolyticus]MCZ6382105.1 hypothetical protein [Vibrio parahaemolyticus]MDF5213157.1 hypothetical protein [Vibrio parahaemolyticus]MDG2565666.1 hypothetical protein [Vibrio parahaemolyticus]MDG2713471.1 hypothetical protein [Vibrio parahaemolyticus]